MKLLANERESPALKAYLRRPGRALISSALAAVEVRRAMRLVDDRPDARATVGALLREVTLHRVNERVLRRASELDPPRLRTLDAIHLATALELEARELLVYDRKLADAARAHGLTVLSPGA